MNEQVERAKEWLDGHGFLYTVQDWSDSCGLWAAGGAVISVHKNTGRRFRGPERVCKIRFWDTHGPVRYMVQGLKDELLLDKASLYAYIRGEE